MPSSGGSSQSRDRTHVSCIAGRFFTIWATKEATLFPQFVSNTKPSLCEHRPYLSGVGAQFLGPATISWQWGGQGNVGGVPPCQPFLHTLDSITNLSGVKRLWSNAPISFTLPRNYTSRFPSVCPMEHQSLQLPSREAREKRFCGLLSLGNTAYCVSVWEIHENVSGLRAWRRIARETK